MPAGDRSLSELSASSQARFRPAAEHGAMPINDSVAVRMRARDRATSLVNELTAGAVIAGLGALGVFGVVDAITVPGSASSPTASTSTPSSTSSSASSSTSTQAGLQPSSGSISSSSSGSGIVVTGGS